MKKTKELLIKINKNHYEIKNELSDKVKSLIKALIEIDPSKRLSLKDIFEHFIFHKNAQKINYNPCLFRSLNICNKYRYE